MTRDIVKKKKDENHRAQCTRSTKKKIEYCRTPKKAKYIKDKSRNTFLCPQCLRM